MGENDGRSELKCETISQLFRRTFPVYVLMQLDMFILNVQNKYLIRQLGNTFRRGAVTGLSKRH